MAIPEHSSCSIPVTTFTPKVFSNPIVDKLDEEGFLPWQQLALATTKGQNLEDHLDVEKVPARLSTKVDEASGVESQTYKEWTQQDYSLMSWLLSSMDISFKNRMVGCNFADEIWQRIEVYFASQTRAKVKQLQTQLKAIKKQGTSQNICSKSRNW